MRIAAFILGILGGLIGLGWAIIRFADEIVRLTEYGTDGFVWILLAVALLSMVGLIGGVLSLTAPKPAGVLMLIPAGVFIAAGVLWLIVTPGAGIVVMSVMAIVLIPLLVGGILACVSQRRSTRQS